MTTTPATDTAYAGTLAEYIADTIVANDDTEIAERMSSTLLEQVIPYLPDTTPNHKPWRHDRGTTEEDQLEGYVNNPSEDCFIEMQIYLVSVPSYSGRWYNWIEEDDNGSYESGEWTQDEDAARSEAAQFAEDNDATEARDEHDSEQETRDARIDELTTNGDWQIVSHDDDDDACVEYSTDSEAEAKELLSLLLERADGDEYYALKNMSICNAGQENADTMAALETPDGDYGVLDMDGTVIAQCESEADAKKWVSLESQSRSLALRGTQGHENSYWPRSVVDLHAPYSRAGAHSTRWSN